MKKIVLTAFVGLVVLGAFESCKKDSSESAVLDNEGLLTLSAWVQVDATLDGVSTWSQYPTCRKDNIMIYERDGSYELKEGDVKCDPSDPDVRESGYWSIADDGSQLSTANATLDIVELTKTRLVLSTQLGSTIANSIFEHE